MQFNLEATGSYSVHIGTIDIMDPAGFNLVTTALNEAMKSCGSIGSTGFREAVEALGGTFEPGNRWPTFILPPDARLNLTYRDYDGRGYALHTVNFRKEKRTTVQCAKFIGFKNDTDVHWVSQPFETAVLQLLALGDYFYVTLRDGAGSSYGKKFASKQDALALFLDIASTTSVSFSALEKDGFKYVQSVSESTATYIHF